MRTHPVNPSHNFWRRMAVCQRNCGQNVQTDGDCHRENSFRRKKVMVNFHLLATENAISVDFAPNLDLKSFLHDRKGIRSKSELKSVSSKELSTRLARAVADMALSPGQMANMPDRSLAAIATAQALAGDAARIRRSPRWR